MEKGNDISEETASQLTKEMVRGADLIITMDALQTATIVAMEPSAKGKVFKLGYWSDFDVPDPYQRELAFFKTTLQLIDKGVSQWLEKL